MTEDHDPTGVESAIESVHHLFNRYTDTGNGLAEQASYLVELSNAISDLASYHPGFDPDTGTLPWQRVCLEKKT